MSELQKLFEKEYRIEHNIPVEIGFTTTHGGNRYAAFEVQTAWSMYCKGFSKGLEWRDSQGNFMGCAE